MAVEHYNRVIMSVMLCKLILTLGSVAFKASILESNLKTASGMVLSFDSVGEILK